MKAESVDVDEIEQVLMNAPLDKIPVILNIPNTLDQDELNGFVVAGARLILAGWKQNEKHPEYFADPKDPYIVYHYTKVEELLEGEE